jgi:two-component system, cell cycle sensor histidine kinase and response regulator CckA
VTSILRALLVEDLEDDARLVLRELKRGGWDVKWKRVQSDAHMRAAMSEPWDLVLSDFSMPGFGALHALRVLKELNSDVPFIIVSGTIGETMAADAMRSGARDYVLKDNLARLVPAVQRELKEYASRKEAERVLHQTENELRQSQKMEAIGVLAGGIAHDFNNLLSVILGYGDMLLGDLPADARGREEIEEIVRAGKRAAELTRQLLAFSRRQVLAPKVLDLNVTLEQIDKMFRRIVGEDIVVSAIREPKLWSVKLDPGQIEQVLLNLVINARDAMPTGGTLTLQTSNVVLDASHIGAREDASPGEHVMLCVSDTGQGMDAATQARIFEPFFTTKEHGTGLGLSTVFGIVRQSEGHVVVQSEIGRGTSFKLYFPRVAGHVASKSGPMKAVIERGSETILLVEDDDQVRALARHILEHGGYRVLEARDAAEGLELARSHRGPIHLTVTDVVMPRMSGSEMAALLLIDRPDTKILFMSGYTDDTIVRHGVLDAGIAFLQKPLTPDGLVRKVREVLDGTGDP